MDIKVTYQSVDGYRETRSYKTASGAKRRIIHCLGQHPEISHRGEYAVSDDGVGICRVRGISLQSLLEGD